MDFQLTPADKGAIRALVTKAETEPLTEARLAEINEIYRVDPLQRPFLPYSLSLPPYHLVYTNELHGDKLVRHLSISKPNSGQLPAVDLPAVDDVVRLMLEFAYNQPYQNYQVKIVNGVVHLFEIINMTKQ